MKKIIAYQLCLLCAVIGLLMQLHFGSTPIAFERFSLLGTCILLGGIGGNVYCLRAIYLNASVRGRWDSQWGPWYYIRPLVSLVCGGISYLFLKAGLLLLEAQSAPESSDFGFMALAFIAGLNVDKFISKIEDIAQASWGIEKSRAGKGE